MGIAHKTVSTGGLQTFCMLRVYPIAASPFAAGCTRHIAAPDKMVSDTFLSLFAYVVIGLFRARHINDRCLAHAYAKRYFLFRLVGDAVASTQPAAMRSFTRLRAWLSVKSLSCAISRSDISPCDRSICSTKLAPP